MSTRALVRAAMHFCAALFLMSVDVSVLPADTIIAPTDFTDATGYSAWQVPCEYEYGPVGPDCGGYYETGLNSLSSAISDAFAPQNDGYPIVTGNSDANFAFQEVDGYSQADRACDIPLDYVIFNNALDTGLVTFTVSSLSNTPMLFARLVTTLYSYNAFTAHVSAYNAQGQLLGSTSSVAAQQNEEYRNVFYPTYSALAGIVDTSAFSYADVASVVISATAPDGSEFDWLGIGATGTIVAPEPGTLGLMLFAAAGMVISHRRIRFHE